MCDVYQRPIAGFSRGGRCPCVLSIIEPQPVLCTQYNLPSTVRNDLRHVFPMTRVIDNTVSTQG